MRQKAASSLTLQQCRENNPYANIITVHRGDEKKKDIVALVDVLHSKEIQDWIRTKYKGAVIPVNN
ncbi:TPA: MetQ/NlpA family ABC transporter substrate-binding protein [Escherichia coli]